MKRVIIILMICCMALLNSCTGNKTAKSIKVMYQGQPWDQEAVKAVSEKFTAKTGINVELIYAPHDGYQEQLSAAISSNKVPDVIQLDGPFLSNLAWSGVIVPLEKYIDTAIINDMTASNVAQCTYPIDNKLYAIGYADSAVCLYANNKYLQKIGARIPTSVDDAWTVDEFEKYLAALAKLPEVKYPLDIMRAYGTKTEWATYGFYCAFVSGGGGVIDPKTGKAGGLLNGAKSLEVAKLFQKWVKNGWIVPASAGSNMFFNDKKEVAIAWCGNWFWSLAYPTVGDDLIALPLPNFGNGVKSPNATFVYAISKNANKELAGKFLSFMCQDKEFLDIQKANGSFPGFKSWAETDPLYSDPKKMKIAYEQALTTAVPRPVHPAYPIITSAFMSVFSDILDGADVQSSLDAAARKIDDDIDDNNGYPPFGKK